MRAPAPRRAPTGNAGARRALGHAGLPPPRAAGQARWTRDGRSIRRVPQRAGRGGGDEQGAAPGAGGVRRARASGRAAEGAAGEGVGDQRAGEAEAASRRQAQRRVDDWARDKGSLRRMLAGLHALLPRTHALATPRLEPFRAVRAAEGAVQKRYRRMLRLIHPDKLSPLVPTEERVAAQMVPAPVAAQRESRRGGRGLRRVARGTREERAGGCARQG